MASSSSTSFCLPAAKTYSLAGSTLAVVAGRVAVCETDRGLGDRSLVRMCLRNEFMV